MARTLRQWLHTLQVAPLSSEPGSPWENGSVESVNGKRREQGVNGAPCDTLKAAQSMTERGRSHDNTVRPHSSLGGQPPAPETVPLAS
jgi:putative transposase